MQILLRSALNSIVPLARLFSAPLILDTENFTIPLASRFTFTST